MNDSKIMKRAEELEELLKPLYILEKEKEKIQRECKHSIVIIIDEYNSYSIDAICMFCGKTFGSNRELYGERSIIDASEYCFRFGKDYVISYIKELYNIIICSSSKLSSSEIANKIKEGLEEEYRETIKQLEDISKKVREKMETID